jgi:hypothetical protein
MALGKPSPYSSRTAAMPTARKVGDTRVAAGSGAPPGRLLPL